MQPVSSQNRNIVLASGSPRRLELMQRLGFEPQVVVSEIPEEIADKESNRAYTVRLAVEKAHDVSRSLEPDASFSNWVLAADTVVVLHGELLEKPGDEREAVNMLQKLSGTHHDVVTSFCWYSREDERHTTRTVEARVEFRKLTAGTIERYVATGEPLDKAGGYGIQDIGSAFVRRVDGSYFAVVGLPVCEVVEVLDEMGGLREYPFLSQSEEAKTDAF